MKQFNRIILGVILVWIFLSGTSALWIVHQKDKIQDKEYLVEINRIQDQFHVQKAFSEINLSEYRYIKQIDYMSVYLNEMISIPNTEELPGEGDTEDKDNGGNNTEDQDNGEENDADTHSPIIELDDYSGKYQFKIFIERDMAIDYSKLLMDFFDGKDDPIYNTKEVPKDCGYKILPLYTNTTLRGFVRYSYITASKDNSATQLVILIEGILGITFLVLLSVLIYVRNAILRPFHEITELPYELSKGHLSQEVKETKNRYFGRFLWGLDMLRESLEEHRRKELQMEKDKKLMILSISHDIKTPLSTIKLYAKALYDNLYSSEEKKKDTARKIEEKADQIEDFVTEIMKTSSTELFEFDVVLGEFYLSNLVETLWKSYSEKLNLLKIDFTIGSYKDKLLTGDTNKLTDVFDNLIQNAIKYGDGKKISISFAEEDHCQLIRIANTGVPLPKENLHHMFESFWRGENAIGKQGNGLGLYICRQLLHKMDGDIYAEAAEDGMSIVVVLKIE
jgi:signal transduction histidine kinase